MSAYAWPIVALILGLCACRVAWELVVGQRRNFRDVASAVSVERSRLDVLAGFVDQQRVDSAKLEERIEALEDWRVKLKNLGVVRD